jgi:hypothetical protein
LLDNYFTLLAKGEIDKWKHDYPDLNLVWLSAQMPMNLV